eukprot:COSAG01_NODE_66675_length_269_cov_0.894118_1_plen_89_part_11
MAGAPSAPKHSPGSDEDVAARMAAMREDEAVEAVDLDYAERTRERVEREEARKEMRRQQREGKRDEKKTALGYAIQRSKDARDTRKTAR